MTEFVTQHPFFSVLVVFLVFLLLDEVQSNFFNPLRAMRSRKDTKE